MKQETLESESIKTKNREIWIDVCRGIGIILVLLGHTNLPDTLYKIIYGFHLPLFFVLSGYLFALTKSTDIPFGKYYLKLFRSYIIPYLILCGVNLILSFAGSLVGFIKDFSLSRYCLGIFVYSWGTREWLPNCSPLWFLTCLFFALLFFYWIMKCKHLIVRILLIAISMGFSYTLSLINAPRLYWNIDAAMMAVPFLAIGAFIYRLNLLKLLKKLNLGLRTVIYVFAAIGGIIAIFFNSTVRFNFNDYGNLALMLVGAVLICFDVIVFSVFISHCFPEKVLILVTTLGKHTLFIMGFDYFAWGIASIVTEKWYLELLIKCVILLIIGVPYCWTIKRIKNPIIHKILSF